MYSCVSCYYVLFKYKRNLLSEVFMLLFRVLLPTDAQKNHPYCCSEIFRLTIHVLMDNWVLSVFSANRGDQSQFLFKVYKSCQQTGSIYVYVSYVGYPWQNAQWRLLRDKLNNKVDISDAGVCVYSKEKKVNVYLSSLMMKVPDHVYVLG
jgi:hypothetical protein